MKTVGIVAEYNPFHAGHRKQFDRIRAEFGEETAIVCAMSGSFVQRGAPAVMDKTLRAKAAVACGADLVVELPTTVSLSSAEGFAAGGVKILSSMCDALCFGAETGEADTLMDTARALLSEGFSPLLRRELDSGKSFPAARADALAQMGLSGEILRRPNDILGGAWGSFVPEPARAVFENAPLHSLAAGERAVLARLRTMADAEFEALPFGGEGLWRKFMHASRREATLEDILISVKSKRYTRTRLDRMMMCAYLGITAETLSAPAPYVRVLAFNEKGRAILSAVKKSGVFRNAGETVPHPYQALEQRWGDLYGLFALEQPEAPGAEQRRRIVFDPG